MRINHIRRARGFTGLACMCLALASCGPTDPEPRSAYGDQRTVAVAEQTAAAVRQADSEATETARRVEAEAERRAEQAETERLDRIADIRHADPALNWVNVGISTGKFSKNVDATVHRTHAECEKASSMEANRCFPIAKLPASYWKAGE